MAWMAANKLRSMPVESALKIGVLDFAASQRHSFENPLMPECGILILFLRRYRALAGDVLVSVPVLFSHKHDLEPHETVCENCGCATPYYFFRQAYNKKSINPIAWLVRRPRNILVPCSLRAAVLREIERQNDDAWQWCSSIRKRAKRATDGSQETRPIARLARILHSAKTACSG